MITETVIHIPASEQTKITVTCDICKKAKGEPDCGGVKWRESHDHNYRRTELSVDLGNYYPDGQSGTRLVLDICPDCITEAFKKFKVESRLEEYSY